MKVRTRLLHKVFPKSSRMGNLYDFCTRGLEIGYMKGFRSFSHSVICFLRNALFQYQYTEWIKKNEPDLQGLERTREICRNFEYRPKISIITPVWNTDEEILRRTIESVIEQVYPDWELLLVDGGSEKPHIKRVLLEYAKKDPRIKITCLSYNKGIAGNSNEGLNDATGEYLGFLDHDDLLSPVTLFEVVSLLNKNRDLVFIYSDEDKIDQQQKRKDPFFKPDWSPDLFLSCNYICHFTVILTARVAGVGGFRSRFDGSQDYDLFLRITEQTDPEKIAHIPKILYHWRVTEGSESGKTGAKPYSGTAAKNALAETLARRGLHAGVEDGLYPGSHRIRYSLLNIPEVTIIIPTKDKVNLLKHCIQTVLDKTTYLNYRILVVDNLSSEPETFAYYDSLRNSTKIRIIHYKKPFNFSAMNNYAVAHADTPYILFLHNDTEVISGDWLDAMLEHIQRQGVGAVGAKLLYPDNTIQHAGLTLGVGGIAGHTYRHHSSDDYGYFGRLVVIQNVSAVTAACMVMSKDLFEDVGGFDEDLTNAFHDVDLCLKLRERGLVIIYTPYAQLYHHESASRGYENTAERKFRFQQDSQIIRQRWGDRISKGDPYYNPNLTLERQDYSLSVNRRALNNRRNGVN